MHNEIIKYYGKTPPNKWVLEKFDITHLEENRTCWDDLKVYIKIDDNKITDWSFEGDTAIMTTACASALWEDILWKKLEEILKFDYDYIEKLIEQPVSKRRKKAAVLGLLTTINAIHKYLDDWEKSNFDDLI